MTWLFSLLLTIHILVAIALIGLVLMQHGKGADMGAAFGSGASGSLFGATGSANFLSRVTAVLATIFFVTSAFLTYQAANRPQSAGSVMQEPIESRPLNDTPLESGKPTTAEGSSTAQTIPK